MLTPISELHGGTFERVIQAGIAELAADAADPNKAVTEKRSVTFRVTLLPSGRGPGSLSIEKTSLKLAKPDKLVRVPVQIDLDGDISERNSDADGHQTLPHHGLSDGASHDN